VLACLILPTVYDLYITIADVEVCAESKLFKVKVPMVFLVEGGFSGRRDGRYTKGLYLRVVGSPNRPRRPGSVEHGQGRVQPL
jgi:hypothetical protein